MARSRSVSICRGTPFRCAQAGFCFGPTRRSRSVCPSRRHGDEGPAFMLPNLVDGADIGMIQCGCGVGFAQEALISLPVFSDVIGKELEGDEVVQLGVLSLV